MLLFQKKKKRLHLVEVEGILTSIYVQKREGPWRCYHPCNSSLPSSDISMYFFLKATVGQSPPATKYINNVGRTNKLTKYLKGGREEDT
jgi:hypothetical protein